MKKVLIFLVFLIPLNISALEIPNLNSSHVLIYDLTSNDTIYTKNSEEKTSIASLTKIATAIVALEKIDNLDELVTVTKTDLANIYWNASVAKLKIGDTITYKDLLYALLLPSGADAAQVLAYHLSGSISNFVNEMNNFGATIGLQNTHFLNITGLDIEGQYSTLQDVLTLLKYAFQNPTFKEVFTTKEYTLTNGLIVKSTLTGYSEKYSLDTTRILGSKTGTTNNAGLCLASYFLVKDHEIFAITTNALYNSKPPYNLIDHLTIINYLDNYYEIKEEVEEESIPLKETTIKENNSYKFNKYYEELSYVIIIILIFLILLIIFKNKKKK